MTSRQNKHIMIIIIIVIIDHHIFLLSSFLEQSQSQSQSFHLASQLSGFRELAKCVKTVLQQGQVTPA